MTAKAQKCMRNTYDSDVIYLIHLITYEYINPDHKHVMLWTAYLPQYNNQESTYFYII